MVSPGPDGPIPVDVEQLVTRLEQLLAVPEPELDRILAVVASVQASAPAEQDLVDSLDRLAEQDHPSAAIPDGPAVLAHVFGPLGFTGARTRYHDPANSLLHEVIERRRGIPLSLAVVACEIGRRWGVDLRPVGLPGHVLVGEGPRPERWFDPFDRGRALDVDACRRLYENFGFQAPFDRSMLKPMGAADVVVRTLNNLRVAHLHRGLSGAIIPILELRASISGRNPAQGTELIEVLVALGRFDRAAELFDELARSDPSRAAEHRRRAFGLRAHRN